MGPLDFEHAAHSPASDGVDGPTRTSTSTAPALHRIDSNAEEDSVAGLGATERLPTKAELRGTLGTVNRKVHTATCYACFAMRRSAHPASLYGIEHDPTCPCNVWPASIICSIACFGSQRVQHDKAEHVPACILVLIFGCSWHCREGRRCS